MASRSKRQKLVYFRAQIDAHIDKIDHDLTSMANIAENESPELDEALFALFRMYEEVRETTARILAFV